VFETSRESKRASSRFLIFLLFYLLLSQTSCPSTETKKRAPLSPTAFFLRLEQSCGLPGQSDVFIHVEGDDVLEGELTGLVELDQVSVDTDWGGTGGESENEGLGGSGGELLDALLDILGCKKESMG